MGPLIGITTAHVEEEISTYPREYYVNSVLKAGGVPVLLPIISLTELAERYLNLIDGLILTGGSDVAPYYFGQEPQRGTGKAYPVRDVYEIELVRKALDGDLPLLGICRGIQVLNIACGGDIYQDINQQVPGALEHSQKAPRAMPWHSVQVVRDSLVGQIFGVAELRVNSFHHQAVNKVATGFRVVAKAHDGIIEAIEHLGKKFVVGVQWHPEAMVDTDTYSHRLFSSLIQACR